jgi:hypothetical protein
MNDTPAQQDQDEPAPRLVARTSLPTDVRLVGGPRPKPGLTDTQPDGIKLPDTKPDGIPMVGTADEDDEDAYADERAEDPDAGNEARHPGQGVTGPRGGGRRHEAGHAEEDLDATPPFGQFRSSPTPPRG